MWRNILAAALALSLAASPAIPQLSNVFYFDNAGNDVTGDGSQANPFAHPSACYNYARAHSWGGARCIGTSGQAFFDFAQIYYPMNGGGTMQFDATSTATPPVPFIWAPPMGSHVHAIQLGDNALVGIQKIHFALGANTQADSYINNHQDGVLDVNLNVTMDGGPVNLIDCDFRSHINVNNGLTINGGVSNFAYKTCPGSTWNINGAEVHTNTPTLNRWAWVVPGAVLQAQGNFSSSGVVAASGALVNSHGSLISLGGALPGGTPTLLGNGLYCTNLSAC